MQRLHVIICQSHPLKKEKSREQKERIKNASFHDLSPIPIFAHLAPLNAREKEDFKNKKGKIEVESRSNPKNVRYQVLFMFCETWVLRMIDPGLTVLGISVYFTKCGASVSERRIVGQTSIGSS